jgi:hypothetical protein
MSNETIYLIAIAAAIVAAVVVAVMLVNRYERQRDAGFKRAVRRLGWQEAYGEATPPQEVIDFFLFGRGRARRTKNLARGRPGKLDATLFDYSFTTGSGKHSHTHRQTVMVFELPGRTVPGFELRPEGVLDKIGAAFGYQDIDLENRPDFSKAYLLRGTDEAEIRRFFQDEIVHHFERHRGWSVEAAGTWVVVYRAGKRVKPDDLRAFVEDCDQIASVVARG